MSDQEYQPQFMLRAIELSETGYKSGKGFPIGCVIVRNGEIIGEGHNEVLERFNPTSHAEMVAIERACKQADNLELEGCELYTTIEPCPMCLAAIYWAKISKVYFATTTKQAAAFDFEDRFIYSELRKNAREREIDFLHIPNEKALMVLKNWESETGGLDEIMDQQ